MHPKIAVVGVGWAGFQPQTPGISYKELMFEAATRAYADAGLDPRRDVDSWVSASEDYHEGTSIFDEYIPDQLGAALRPAHTVAADGLHALATGWMLIASGVARVVAVEAHSKASDILSLPEITAFALDPVVERPLGIHPVAIAGLEADLAYSRGAFTREDTARVVVKNKGNALKNPRASFAARLSVEDVLAAEPLATPLTVLDEAPRADAAIVLVLASEDVVKALDVDPVWIRGVGWSQDAPSLETREWEEATYAQEAAKRAYRMAAIKDPSAQLDLAEIDDTYSHKELLHMEALGLAPEGEAGYLVAKGYTDLDGELPVNPSGGSLGWGNLLEATGLARAMEVVLQLRGEAGAHQVEGCEQGLAMSWRGLPTASGAVAIFGV